MPAGISWGLSTPSPGDKSNVHINEVVFVAILSRNHNVLDAYDQDPGVWAGGRVARAARAALTVKGSGAWC